jgi:HK97 family phage prohead protease
MRPSLESRLVNLRFDGAVELRESADNTVEFRGYATTYEYAYPVAGGPDSGGWNETISAGAARRTLNARPDVRLLVNHDGLPLARTRSGTLLLEEDERGLLVVAPSLDLSNPLVQQVRSAMQRGDVDEMSFAFRPTRQEWNADYTERIIREFALDVSGSDVSIVTYPANPATVAQLRSAAGLEDVRPAARSGMSLSMAKAIAARSAVR